MGEKKERPPIRLVKAAVEDLAPEAGPYFVPVVNAKSQAVQGLNLRVLPSGVKAWVHRYRFAGFQKSLTLGRYPAMGPEMAEKASRAAQTKIDAGTDPGLAKANARKAAEEARRAAVTVKDLAERYELEHVPELGESWGDETKRLVKLFILPALGKLPVAAVGPADVSAMLFKIRQATPTQANRVRAVMRTMFGRAEEWELRPLGSNPVAVVKQRAPEVKRERRLSDIELKKLGATLQKSAEPAQLVLAVRLALLAGMRKGEVAGARWEWVDLRAGEIRIPKEAHKTGRKTQRARVVHLCEALVTHMKAAPRTLGCPFVIPGRPERNDEGKVAGWAPIQGLQKAWERIRDAAGLAPRDEKTGEYLDPENNPGLHDLRRTFASVGADLGLKGFVGELLGHAEATVTDIYTRSAADPLHQAAEKIGARIEGILTGAIDPEKEAEERRRAKEGKGRGAS
ncbi:tyrosine-type recombinase/integrase [Mesoterricola sediminis]|uniref:Integrase n=1 Tax=Mesoterricola sediminis TaxID=2927980 RepID=A0AA48GYK2_9BACT|nr:integrase family protein [Mesoterricola sediminis]BDU76412.1 integrase [Mesoterricola sediminis]